MGAAVVANMLRGLLQALRVFLLQTGLQLSQLLWGQLQVLAAGIDCFTLKCTQHVHVDTYKCACIAVASYPSRACLVGFAPHWQLQVPVAAAGVGGLLVARCSKCNGRCICKCPVSLVWLKLLEP